MSNNTSLGLFNSINVLTFKKINMDFNNKNGLIVFTGPSGAGKSVLMNTILSSIGVSEVMAEDINVEINNKDIIEERFGIVPKEDFVINVQKNTKVRYYLNDKMISKKGLKELISPKIKHLSLKDYTEFDNINILNFIDELIKDKQLIKEYKAKYQEYKDIKLELNKIKRLQQESEEKKDFLEFEINKIKNINPKEGELEELRELKDKISKKDNIMENINMGISIINSESISKLISSLNVLEKQEESEALKLQLEELEDVFRKEESKYIDVDIDNIEEILDRISDINGLIKKYGDVNNCLKILKDKEEELNLINNSEYELAILEKNEKKILKILEGLSFKITENRYNIIQKEILPIFNEYLSKLYIEGFNITIKKIELNSLGVDEIVFSINNSDLKNVSSGEFNRLRLAFLAVKAKYQNNDGILFLDEIDANLSGKESESIGNVLVDLAKNYQIFAISHQPQLTSMANKHFVVEKNNNNSIVRELIKKEEKIEEISRMISGTEINNKAKQFAEDLIKNKGK